MIELAGSSIPHKKKKTIYEIEIDAAKTRSPIRGILAARKAEGLIAKGYTDVEACHKAGMSTEEYIKLRGTSAELQSGYQRAKDEQIQWYEKMARKRAIKGYIETTYDAQGNVKKSVQKFDNDLLIKMLGARDKRYRTAVKSGEINVNFDFAGKLEAARARVQKLKKEKSE
jgi:hypothetical protein